MLNNTRRVISNLPLNWKRVILIGFDVVALTFALWISYGVRYGSIYWVTSFDQLILVAAAPVIAIPVFARMGLYRAVIRYLPERAIWTILQAMTIASVLLVLAIFLLEMAGRGIVPRSVPIFYWAIGTAVVSGSRFAAKKFLWAHERGSSAESPVIIYGAGEAGIALALSLRRQGQRYVIGFLDDSPTLQGRDVAGVRVFPPTELPDLVRDYGVKEVILSIPSLSVVKRKAIVESVNRHGVKVRALPHIADLVAGKYLVNQIKEIDIDELLGRSSVPPDPDLLREMVRDKVIMVTGAGGSIGSELCHLIAKWAPKELVLFEASEFALYSIDRELNENSELLIVPVLGSIKDRVRLESTISTHSVQVIFHAAAHKHVPLLESNVLEGVQNNIFGTENVAEAALAGNVETLVLISSDKAVRPTNVMGATKRWAELLVQRAARQAVRNGSRQRFCSVRFGNVLGSNGSVVPLFREQIANGGPVTLTDPEMTRYFMSIHEASELIVQSGALAEGGDVFLLEMGEPILVRELAENMIRLAGFTIRDEENPSGDIEILVTGKRPGEKLYEELFYDQRSASKTRHPKIFRSMENDRTIDSIDENLDELRLAVENRDEQRVKAILFRLAS